ncbi:MAG: ABC transporter substrate-binding protein [Deltaproteobacteria bacterium]|nr:ABC transporter substrate-binding protein [Deltaproteobacteria bacterium]
MRRRTALSAIAALPLACARVGSRDDALEVVIPNDPATVDPRFTTDVYGLRVARLVHAALVAPDADSAAPTPWLAESLVDDEGGALLVTLREGARFHDGTAVTARDVVATFHTLADEKLGSPSRRVLAELSSVMAIDARRVRIAPKRPRATLRGDLDVAILKADEAKLPRDAPLTGCGPFRLVDRRPGAILLEPAATYAWFDAPARRRVVVRTVRDEPARALRIVAGSVDVASNVLAPALAFALPGRSDAPRGLEARRRAAAATTFLAIQCARPELGAPEVRRAIAAAIDRATIVQAKLGGAAALADGLLPNAIALAPRGRAPLAFDPAGARSVLSPLGARGVRWTLVTSTDRTRVGIARALSQSLSDAGVPTEVRTYEFGTFFARLSAGDFDLAPLIASEVSDPDVLRWYLHAEALPPRGANRARLTDARVDALLDRGLATLDLAARRGVYEELEQVLRESMPYVPLWHEDHVAVTSARAATFRPSVDGRWGALARIV